MRLSAGVDAVEIRRIAYPGMDRDVPTIIVANLLVVHRDFPEELAYQITKLLFERRRELEIVHAEAKNITLLRITGRTPIPFHPGAARYYREKNISGF